ncbi:hypothetical protein GCM10009410_15120 [Shewanella ulleungensis]|uniref:Uncharacterized protein n=1 Tax=Shewanella ulleungensis TaxID=2282699 RepID=A0ABQ2QKL8_9GAMM|nr:hypothetical protein GCM10009410_15120 [Shewanella ulleungensis]
MGIMANSDNPKIKVPIASIVTIEFRCAVVCRGHKCPINEEQLSQQSWLNYQFSECIKKRIFTRDENKLTR